MAYIGARPVNGFFSKQDISTDGSTTTFALDFTVSSTSSIIVSVGGVIQEPDTAYTLSGGNTSIVFSEAPSATADTYIHYLGSAIVQTITDLNGTELILDIDADTTITADTDDEIDIKVAGSDISTIKSTGYHNLDSIKFIAGTGDDLQIYHDGTNSYIANAVGALKVATETSGIAVTIGHTTSEVTFGDNVTVTGNLTIGGTTNFGDFNITNVGSIALDTITNDGTDITLDSSGDIILDAAGNDIFFKAGGTTIGEIENESNNLIIKSSVSDADLILRGNDGGSEISALTFDMSAAGKATFNDQVVVGDGKLVLNATAITATGAEINLIDGGATVGTTAVASGDGVITNDGGTMRVTNIDTFDTYLSATTKTLTNKTLTTPVIATISSSSNDMTLDAGADIILDADGADILLKDGGTHIGNVNLTSSNLTVKSIVGDKDIIFQGVDDSSNITALTLDMSDAGTAVFNHDIKIADDGQIGSASAADAMIISSGGIVTFKDDILIKDGGTIGTASDADSITIASNGAVTLTQALAGTSADFDGGVTVDNITIDGTEIDLSSGDLTIDVAGDLVLDAGGGDFKFGVGGTEILRITNSSSDVIIKPTVDTKDIIFQQFDGTEVARVEDNGTFNVATAKLAINGTAITSTAAELNHVDGVTSAVQTQLDAKASTGKAIAMAIVFG